MRSALGSESLQFLEALGKTRIANVARSYKLGDTRKLFYLQERSSSGGRLGTQPMVATSIHQSRPDADLWKGPYFVETNDSPPINLPLVALFDQKST